MSGTKKEDTWSKKYTFAILIFIAAVIGIYLLAILAIENDKSNAMTIFHIVLPVFASWVGAILAFYYGRENFESANTEIREIIKTLTPDEMARNPVNGIMRKFSDTDHFTIPDGKSDEDIKLQEIYGKFNEKISRLPIINPNNSPKYMIHASSIEKFLMKNQVQDKDYTLAEFIASRKKEGMEFGINKGFIVVSEKSSIADAKLRMEHIPVCQDIFVTQKGTEKEPLQGWISNVRLVKFLPE
jgi:hypothetical protein